MALKAVLFDVDGTMADTEPKGHLPSYNSAFKKLGLNWKWTRKFYRHDLLQLSGGRERIDHFLQEYDPPIAGHESAIEADRVAWINDVHKLKSEIFAQRVQGGKVPLRPGVDRLIRELSQSGIQLVIVTNASRATLEPFLAHTLGSNLRSRFDLVVSGEQVGKKKPEPDVYLRALELLRLEADECVAIEDSEMGLTSAFRAGISTLVTVNADTRHHNLRKAKLVVNHLGDPDQPSRALRGKLADGEWITPEALERLLPN